MFGNKKLKLEVSDLKEVIFNLRELLNRKELELAEKEKLLNDAKRIIQEYWELDDATPEDCKRGTWCEACEFATNIRVDNIFGSFRKVYFCGKGESCKNFIQKEN